MQTLQELGLTKNEDTIYTKLLRLGPSTAGEITEGTGIHRRNVYDSLERLIQKGLVGFFSKKGRKYFQASDPRRFLDIIKEENEIQASKENLVNQILPQLLSIQNSQKKSEDVIVYRGREGYKIFHNDLLKVAKEIWVLGSKMPDFLLDIVEKYHKIRVKKKIKLKMILNATDFKRGRELSKLPYTEIKYLPEKYESPIFIDMYADRLVLFIFHDEKDCITINPADA